MTVSPKDSRLMLLLSSILIVIPMVVFPAKLGTELSSGSFIYALFEILYYGIILFIMRPGSSLFQLFQGASLTFLFRIVIGTVFGIFISIMYDVSITASMTLGISKYLPAIILHVAAAPFVIKPFYLAILGEKSGDDLRRVIRSKTAIPTTSVVASTSTSQIFRPVDKTAPKVSNEFKTDEGRTASITEKDSNGFNRAVKYIGEHHSVKLATVVDFEGLTMASFSRDGIDIEDWAPFALVFEEANKAILERFSEKNEPERIDLTYSDGKLHVIKIREFNLLVLSTREDDDLLGIRLAQASDIIRKYISERYDKLLSVSPEEKYVPST